MDEFFTVDAATVSANRETVTVSMCDRCTFYKNSGAEEGSTCRRVDCGGTVHRIVYRRETR